jgi:mRNA interferase RelE/StbE
VKSAFRNSFLRDLRKLSDEDVQKKVREAILAVEAATDLRDTPNLKKLSGSGPYFRIRIGDYRIGMRVEDDLVTFVRVLHRRDIYRYFP